MQAIYALADTPRGPFIDTKPQRVAGEHQPGDNDMENIYEQNGYDTRAEYLKYLAADHGIDLNIVLNLAELLGPNEDFDGLVTTLQDHAP